MRSFGLELFEEEPLSLSYSYRHTSLLNVVFATKLGFNTKFVVCHRIARMAHAIFEPRVLAAVRMRAGKHTQQVAKVEAGANASLLACFYSIRKMLSTNTKFSHCESLQTCASVYSNVCTPTLLADRALTCCTSLTLTLFLPISHSFSRTETAKDNICASTAATAASNKFPCRMQQVARTRLSI